MSTITHLMRCLVVSSPLCVQLEKGIEHESKFKSMAFELCRLSSVIVLRKYDAQSCSLFFHFCLCNLFVMLKFGM